MWLWYIIFIFLTALVGAICIVLTHDRETAIFGPLLTHIVFAVIGNKLTARWLLRRGWIAEA